MGWRRGFFRLWLVVSGLWVLTFGVLLINLGSTNWLLSVTAMVGVPIVVFIIGWLLGWVFKGFQRSKPILPR